MLFPAVIVQYMHDFSMHWGKNDRTTQSPCLLGISSAWKPQGLFTISVRTLHGNCAQYPHNLCSLFYKDLPQELSTWWHSIIPLRHRAEASHHRVSQ